jgi:DNA-binding MarR family transcriptional regulator
VVSAVDTTSVSSAAISEPIPVNATTQRVEDLVFMQVLIRAGHQIHRSLSKSVVDAIVRHVYYLVRHMNYLHDDVGFLLAKATQRWNELLLQRFAAAGYPEIKASFGSVLLPLFDEDGLRIGEIGRRARLSKPSMTALVAHCEQAGLVRRERDPEDGRAFRVVLTDRGRRFKTVADEVLAELNARVPPEDRDALVRGLKGVMDL